MSRNHWFESPDDIQWLKDVYLNGIQLPDEYQNFQTAIIQGSEDSLYAINVYNSASPALSDPYCRVVFATDENEVLQHNIAIIDRKTDEAIKQLFHFDER